MRSPSLRRNACPLALASCFVRRRAFLAHSGAAMVLALLWLTQPCQGQNGWPFGQSLEADNLKRKANALNAKDRYAEALPLIQRSVHIERQLYGDQDRRLLDGLGVLAYTYYKLARYHDALSIDERRWRLSVKTLGEKDPVSITALRDLAIAYENTDHDYSRSVPLLEKALRLRTEVLGEQHQDTMQVMNDVANAYLFMGRGAESLALHEKTLRIATAAFGSKGGDTELALLTLALAYSNMGREAEALPLFDKILRDSVASSGEKSKGSIFNLVRVAGSYSRMNRNAEALKLMQRAMQLRQEVFPARDRETIYFIETLADIYINLNRAAEALPLLADAVQLYTADGGERSFITLRSMNKLAHCHEVAGNMEEARKLHLRVLQLQTEGLGEHHPDTVVSMVSLARIERSLGHQMEAGALYEKVVPAVEALRASGDLSPENRQALFAQWVDAYKAYAGILIEAGNHVEAFRLGELSKARTLLESTAVRYANQSAVLNTQERERTQAFERRIARLSDAIAATGSRAEQRFVLEADKSRAIAEYAGYRRELAAKYPKYAQLNDVKMLGPEAAREVLPDGCLFISYLLDADRPLVFTLSSRDLHAQELPAVPALAQTIEAYRRLMSRLVGELDEGESAWRLPDGSYLVASSSPGPDAYRVSDAAEIGRYLSLKILEPLAQRLSGWQKLIISADGALATIPFETLPLAGRLMIADHDVSYVQSLSMLALLKSRDEDYRKRGERKDLFAMGNAIYEEVAGDTKGPRSVRMTQGAPRAGLDLSKILNRNAGDPQSIQRLFTLLHARWPNLPGTEKEIAKVAEIFGSEHATVYTRQDATEAKLLQLNSQRLLTDFRYLLFSAHGFLSLEEPALSALVLGQVHKAPGTDGYVTAAEWPGYELSSDLVVLSACETGLGKIVHGEGVMGLPYALYVAGNKNTLLSLWAVADDSTAEFMGAFFSKLKGGMDQSAALNQTKREFIAGPLFKDPVFWAPFVLYGY
jgi:CHAT domain-containing protein